MGTQMRVTIKDPELSSTSRQAMRICQNTQNEKMRIDVLCCPFIASNGGSLRPPPQQKVGSWLPAPLLRNPNWVMEIQQP